MKKFAVHILLLILCAALVLPMAPARAAGEGKTMRIGLNYGSGAVAWAALENVENSGFRFGYYDARRTFVPLGQTEETKVSAVKTETLYLASDGSYTASASGAKGTLGPYHVQLPGTYPDFASAQAAAGGVQGGFVAWIKGVYYVRTGTYASAADARAAADALGVADTKILGTSAYSVNVVATGTTRVLFQFDGGDTGETNALAVVPGLREDVKAKTQYQKGNIYYGGFRFERISGGNMTVVNMVDLEDYVKGVIPYEMSASWPIEALKAQTVAARSYAYSLGTKHANHHVDLCTTTDCQVYRGTARANEVTDRAVDETAKQMAYYNGRVANTVYFSSDGGATESSKNVWGTDNGFLQGVVDPYEADVADRVSNYYWTKSFTPQDLKDLLHADGYLCADIVDFRVSQTSATGNAVAITLTDANGKNYTFSRSKMRSILGGLRSIHFTVTCSGGAGASGGGYIIAGNPQAVGDLTTQYAISGDGTVDRVTDGAYAITGEGTERLQPAQPGAPSTGGETVYTLSGSGWGHNVGMSQWGAYAMANRGYTYQDILKFYYTGITVE